MGNVHGDAAPFLLSATPHSHPHHHQEINVTGIRYAFASAVAVALVLPAAGLAMAHKSNARPATAKPLVKVGTARSTVRRPRSSWVPRDSLCTIKPRRIPAR